MKSEEKKAPKGAISPELVAKARAGDQDAFSALYEQTHLVLYRSVRSMVRDEDLAWDVLQDSYLRAYQSLDKLEADEAFLPWLRRIAVNEAARQTAKRLPLSFSDLAGGDEGEEDREPVIPDLRIESQPELALDRKETSRLVREILAGLPEQQQLIVGMHYYEDMPIKEIAELLNLAPGTVKAQLFKGRRHVETKVRALERQGVKLYGMGPVPFLVALLRRLEPTRQAEKKAAAAVLAETAASGGSQITALTAGQAFLHGLGAKLAAGLLAVALLAGGIWAGSRLLKDHQSSLNSQTSEPQVFYTEAPVVPTQPVGSEEESLSPPELTGNECGAEGANLTWSFDPQTGTLTIEGNGAMADYFDSESDGLSSTTPWSNDSAYITNVSLPEQLTSIGSGAFFDCYNLQEATIPAAVTAIGDYAFYRCCISSVTIPASVTHISNKAFSDCSLSEINVVPDNPVYSSDDYGVLFNKDQTVLIRFPIGYQGSYAIPESVTAIADSAFCSCDDLTSVTIPEGVTSIGEYAFYECYSLRSLTIPEGVASIGDYTFDGCSQLSSVTIPTSVTAIGDHAFPTARFFVAPENPAFCSDENGVLFDKAQTVLIRFPNDYQGSYAVPESVSSIGDSAFYGCYDLTSVTIPEGVTSIGDSAFCECIGLRSVMIPEGVTSIGDTAFYGCSGLSSVTISKGVTFIGSFAFSYCSSLHSVEIPEGVNTIGNHAFFECDDLNSVTIPASVTTIGDHAFPHAEIFVAPDNPNYSSDENGVLFNKEQTVLIQFPNDYQGSYAIPESVSVIGNYAFRNCDGLTSVTIPAGVTSMGIYAFSECYNLRATTICEGVTSISENAFSNCIALSSVTIPTSVTAIGNEAFFGCNALTSMTLPEGVTTIGRSTFGLCAQLSSVTIPASVTDIGEKAFDDCGSLTGIFVAPGNPAYSSDETGVLFNKTQTVLIRFPNDFQGSYSIPESVTFIVDHAFSDCNGLISAAIPEGVTSIGDSAFFGCGELSSITIPNSVTSIGDSVFSYCNSLSSIAIPDGVTSIGESAFYSCSSIRSATIPAEVTSIGESAFYDCISLRSLTICEGVTSIGKSAVYNCSSLTSAMIPASVTSICNYAFDECPNLTIHGAPDSTAERYANENDIPFEAIP